jgi:hypothetical protein
MEQILIQLKLGILLFILQVVFLLRGRMGAVELSVKQRLDKVRAARVNLAAANITIQEFKRNIADALNASVDAKVRIENMAGFVDELEQNRNGALQTIGDAQVSLEEMARKGKDDWTN